MTIIFKDKYEHCKFNRHGIYITNCDTEIHYSFDKLYHENDFEFEIPRTYSSESDLDEIIEFLTAAKVALGKQNEQ